MSNILQHETEMNSRLPKWLFLIGRQLKLTVYALAIILAFYCLLSHYLHLPTFPEEHTEVVTLGLLAMFALSITIALKEMTKGIMAVLSCKGYAKTCVFDNVDEYYAAITLRLQKASKVYALNFISQPPNGPSSRVEYYATLKRLVKKKRITAKRIAAIAHLDKWTWFKDDQVEAFKGCENFSSAYIESGVLDDSPIMTVIIIDDEVFWGMYWGAESTGDMEKNIWIQSPDISAAFLHYFDTLWQHKETKVALNRGVPNDDNIRYGNDRFTS